MAYQPFPIYNLSTGKVTAREPWLLPKDAFETLVNCHLRRGVLEKRKGTDPLPGIQTSRL